MPVRCKCEDSSWQQLDMLDFLSVLKQERFRTQQRLTRRKYTPDEDKDQIWDSGLVECYETATAKYIKQGNVSWAKLRSIVWERDDGRCDSCGMALYRDEYHLGHKVDRCCGGIDCLCNLAVQCSTCNMCKPLHKTLEQYAQWIESGGAFAAIVQGV